MPNNRESAENIVLAYAISIFPNVDSFRLRLLDHLLWLVNKPYADLAESNLYRSLLSQLESPLAQKTRSISLDVGQYEYTFDIDPVKITVSVSRPLRKGDLASQNLEESIRALELACSEFALNIDPQLVLIGILASKYERETADLFTVTGILRAEVEDAIERESCIVWTHAGVIRVLYAQSGDSDSTDAIIGGLTASILLSAFVEITEFLRNQIWDLRDSIQILLDPNAKKDLVSSIRELSYRLLVIGDELSTVQRRIGAVTSSVQLLPSFGSDSGEITEKILHTSIQNATDTINEASSDLTAVETQVSVWADTSLTEQAQNQALQESLLNKSLAIIQVIFAFEVITSLGLILVQLLEDAYCRQELEVWFATVAFFEDMNAGICQLKVASQATIYLVVAVVVISIISIILNWRSLGRSRDSAQY